MRIRAAARGAAASTLRIARVPAPPKGLHARTLPGDYCRPVNTALRDYNLRLCEEVDAPIVAAHPMPFGYSNVHSARFANPALRHTAFDAALSTFGKACRNRCFRSLRASDRAASAARVPSPARRTWKGPSSRLRRLRSRATFSPKSPPIAGSPSVACSSHRSSFVHGRGVTIADAFGAGAYRNCLLAVMTC